MLNPPAAVIWLACDGTCDLDGVIDTVADATGIDRAALVDDVTTAVDAMVAAGLVQRAPSPSTPEEARALSGDCGCAPPVRRRSRAEPDALVVDLGGGTLAIRVIGDDDLRERLGTVLRDAGVLVDADPGDDEHDLLHVHVGSGHATVTRWDGGTWPRTRDDVFGFILGSIAEHAMAAPGGLRLRARVDEAGPGTVTLHVDAEAEPVGVLPDGRITRARVAPPERVVGVHVPEPLPPGPTPLVRALLAIGREVTDLHATGRGTLDDLAHIVSSWPLAPTSDP